MNSSFVAESLTVEIPGLADSGIRQKQHKGILKCFLCNSKLYTFTQSSRAHNILMAYQQKTIDYILLLMEK